MKLASLVVIALLVLSAILFVERHPSTNPVSLAAVMHLLADFEREAERIPLMVTRVSDEEENKIGLQIARNQIIQRRQGSNDPEAPAMEGYVREVGEKLSRHVSRAGMRYQFYLENQRRFANAFALPGGHIVMGRGLLELMDSEDELAAVLGHEIAHVDRRHCIERLQYELAARKLGLTLPYAIASIPVAIFRAGYSKDLELEADRVGIGFAVAEGYSPQGAIDMFRRFQKLYERRRAGRSSPGAEIAGAVLGGLGEYLRSHPPSSERISEIEKESIARHWNNKSVRRSRLKN